MSVWKNHRKLLNPAFSQLVLDSFIGVFNKQSRRLVKDLEAEIGKGPFDHWTYTRHNALETICCKYLWLCFLLFFAFKGIAASVFNSAILVKFITEIKFVV